MPVERKKEIRRRRQRKQKLHMLKHKLAEAKDTKIKEKLIEKIKRIQPGFIPPD